MLVSWFAHGHGDSQAIPADHRCWMPVAYQNNVLVHSLVGNALFHWLCCSIGFAGWVDRASSPVSLPLIALQLSPALYHPSSHATSNVLAPRYDGPLEYLTMWACLFLSQAACALLQECQSHDPNWDVLQDIRKNMSAAQSMHPHPLDVLLQFRAACRPNA